MEMVAIYLLYVFEDVLYFHVYLINLKLKCMSYFQKKMAVWLLLKILRTLVPLVLDFK